MSYVHNHTFYEVSSLRYESCKLCLEIKLTSQNQSHFSVVKSVGVLEKCRYIRNKSSVSANTPTLVTKETIATRPEVGYNVKF